VPSQSTASS